MSLLLAGLPPEADAAAAVGTMVAALAVRAVVFLAGGGSFLRHPD
jgi:hypothetical protein